MLRGRPRAEEGESLGGGRNRPHVREAAALVPATVAAILAVSMVGGAGTSGSAPAPGPAGTVTTAQVRAAVHASPGAGRIQLRIDDDLATATLDSTAVAQRFAAMLPVEVTLRDPMGRTKSGRLPQPLDVSGAEQVVDPDVAVLYYWPPGGDLAIFYEDFDDLVPPPGLVRLGTVDVGLDAIASAGNRFEMRIEES